MPINSFENYPMSWKPDLSNTKPPIYLALVRQLEDDIKAGALKPGTKLPPQRELADYLDINLSTVSRAFKICEQKGLLSASVGMALIFHRMLHLTKYLFADKKTRHLLKWAGYTPI